MYEILSGYRKILLTKIYMILLSGSRKILLTKICLILLSDYRKILFTKICLILLSGSKKIKSLSEGHQSYICQLTSATMETLKQLMSLIDANSEKFPEGDYLAMCNAMKEVHGNMKPDRVRVRSMEYYEMEDELINVTQELTRLHKERDNIHYRTKMTKAMKTEAIRVYAFTEGLHSLREYSVEALVEADVRVNYGELFSKHLSEVNDDVYEKKKIVHLMIEEARCHRDDVVYRMADEL